MALFKFFLGVLFGQLSILILFGLSISFLFLVPGSLDAASTSQVSELSEAPHSSGTSGYAKEDFDAACLLDFHSTKNDCEFGLSNITSVQGGWHVDSLLEWLNTVLKHATHTYRSKLCDGDLGSGCLTARRRIEHLANNPRPPGLNRPIEIRGIVLGTTAPILSNPRPTFRVGASGTSYLERVDFDIIYVDNLSITIWTGVIRHIIIRHSIRIRLTASLYGLSSTMSLILPDPLAAKPTLKLIMHPAQAHGLYITSRIGKIIQFDDVDEVEYAVRDAIYGIIGRTRTWELPLPSLPAFLASDI